MVFGKKKKDAGITMDDNTIKNTTVALIGCGPAGMSFLHALQKRKSDGKAVPTVTCYERASSVGGIWRDVPSDDLKRVKECNRCLMYEDMWCNTPKELMEYYDFTFDDHFQCATPSFLPRKDILSYIVGRNSVDGALDHVKLNHSVKSITFNSKIKKFTISIKNEISGICKSSDFDKCIWGAGLHGKPYHPEDILKSLSSFTGKILHSVEVTDNFKNDVNGKRVLIVGDNVSAEDLALHSIKHGAKHVYISSRSGDGVASDTGSWPHDKVTVFDGPPYKVINGNTIKCQEVYWSIKKEKYRRDDDAQPSKVKDIDIIILATGYDPNFDFLPESLQFDDEAEWSISKGWSMDNNALSNSVGKVNPHEILEGGNTCYPDVYRGLLISNPNMMFIHELELSLCPILELDVLAHLILAYLVGEKSIPTTQEMQKANQKQLEAEMHIPWLRASLDPLYQDEINEFDDQHWVNNSNDERVLILNQMANDLAVRRLARDMKDAKYPLNLGDWKSLNKDGKKVIDIITAVENTRSKRRSKGNLTYRDSHLKETLSLFTGTRAAEMPGSWLELKSKDCMNTTLKSLRY